MLPQPPPPEVTMPETRARARRALFILILASLFVVPLATGFLSPFSSAYAQIEFTPNVSTLVVTVSPQPATIGPLIWAPGMQFDCPVGMPERCRPDVVNIHGDDLFGWAELIGDPNLRLVWITDETGTHYMVVPTDDPQFSGLAGGGSFADLIEDREEEIRYIQDREWEITGSVVAPGALIVALLLLCPETAGTTCLLAGIGAAATGLGNVIRNAGMEANAQDRLSRSEDNLAGRFQQLEATIVTPP
jgi:hypothetical protein